MAWKKVIVSGSQAELSNLVVDSNVTASNLQVEDVNSTGEFTIENTDARITLDRAATSNDSEIVFKTSGTENWSIGTGQVGGDNNFTFRSFGSSNAIILRQNGHIEAQGDISASSLQLSGDANIDGNITLGGSITLGDSDTDNIILSGELSSSIIPDADGTYDLGSNTKRWANVYGDTLYGDGSNITNITVSQAATVASSFTNQTTVAVSHNFDSKNVNVAVYNDSDQLILPATVTLTDNDTVTVTFDSSTSGRVVVAKGGHIVSGSVSADNIDGFDTKVKTKLDAENVVSSSAQIVDALPTGTVSGSAQITALGFVSESFSTDGTGIVSSSAFSSPTQGTVRATINGVDTDVDTGLQTGDSPQFTNLTLTGDLTVQGTTTSIETANLLVEDKFILLNSGSGNPQEGGLIIDEGNGQGHAFVYDSNSSRFGFTGSLAHDSTSTAPDAFVGAVVDIDAGHTDVAEYQKNGNIKTDGGTIYIYS